MLVVGIQRDGYIRVRAKVHPYIDLIKKKGENFIVVFVVMSVPMMEV